MGAEDCELIKYFDWVQWQEKQFPEFKAIYHVANERRTSWKAGKILKQKGVRAGILDVHCDIPRPPYPGLRIELKVGNNKLSFEQENMVQLFHGLGFMVRVAYSADEMIKITKDYLWPLPIKTTT